MRQTREEKRTNKENNANAASATDAATQANRPDIETAYGNQQWKQGANGEWELKNSFNGDLGSANQSLQQQYADMLKKPMDDGTGARNQAIDSAYGQATSRLDPQWDKRQSAMQTQLLNQGLDPTSEAGKSAMQEFGQQRNDAYSSAMNGAIGQGTQAGDVAFRNNLAARQAPLQQMQGMNSLLETPKFNGAGTAQTYEQKPADWLAATRDTNNAGQTDIRNNEKTIMGLGQMWSNVVSPLGGMLGGK